MSLAWDVMKAVRGSTLSAPSRHIVLTLASLADQHTGIVPAQYTPSITDLVEQTGLGRSTITEHLNFTEEWKWVERDRPSVADARIHKARTQYRVRVGHNPDGSSPNVGLVRQADQPSHNEADYPTQDAKPARPPGGPTESTEPDDSATELVRQADQPDPGESDIDQSELVRQADQARPPGGREVLSKNSPDQEQSQPPKNGRTKVRDIPRPDVDELCQRLADWMIRNECKPPEITQAWRDEARRMLDIDKRDFAKSLILLDWCQESTFWRANIQSMPTFRAQYDKLRLQANAEHEADRARGQPTFVERHGRRLKPDIARLIDDDQRWAAEDAARTQRQRPAIEGTAP